MMNYVRMIGLLFLVVLTGCQSSQNQGTIAFSRLTGDYWQLWTAQPNGKGSSQLTSSPSDKRYPCWSRQDNRLFYRNNNNQAFVLDVQSADETRILNQLGMISSLEESPDGKQLLLVRFRTELKDSSDIWLVSHDGKARTRLTSDVGMQYDPSWSPDGTKMALISGPGYQGHELYIMDADGKNRQQLTDDKALELLPCFSPDGQMIAYVSDIAGNYDIWLRDADGANPRQLTQYPGMDTRPCWSPDGKKLLFVSDRSGQQQLWIMDLNGNKAKQLTHGPQSMDPAWKP